MVVVPADPPEGAETLSTNNNNGYDHDDYQALKQVEEGGGVTVQDVTNRTPAESKEETAVLRSLEEQARSSTASLQDGLPDLPTEGLDTSSSKNDDSDRTKKQDAATRTPAVDSVEKELHDLVGEFRADDPHHAASVRSSTGSVEKANHASTTAFGKFAGDADKLIEKARVLHYEQKLRENAKDTYDDFKKYVTTKKSNLWSYAKSRTILALSATALAFIIFHTPPKPDPNSTTASTPWWLLFLFVRQVITWSLAKVTQAIVIDFLCLRHPILLVALGPYLTLLLLQSKGWPFHVIMWSAYNFAMLYGDRDFARHWMYYQTTFQLFSKANPAGTVTHSKLYTNILLFALFTGILYSLKRFFMGLLYGRTVYQRFGKELTAVLKKGILIKKLAKHAKAKDDTEASQPLAKKADTSKHQIDLTKFTGSGTSSSPPKEGKEANDNDDTDASSNTFGEEEVLIQTNNRDGLTDSLAASQKLQIKNLLGEWEEPITDERKVEQADISAIVQFRTAVSCIDKYHPFSTYFGLADTRENCIDSAQKLYLRLKGPDDGILSFNKIAEIAIRKDDEQLDKEMVKELIKLFRPTREGELNMLDFLKSIDTVYKELRMLQASILNLQAMHSAFQKLWDFVFNTFICWIFLLALGIDPITVIGSLTALIVGFSFMVGNALSKAFEGLLLVLVRKPYDVGDRIAVAAVDEVANGDGSSGWVVKDLNLYTTTLVYGTTGEEATFTNGYLNGYRIINMNRSPKAVLAFVMKFGIDVSKDKINAFGKEVEAYVKDRPREWLSFGAYRLIGVEADLGYVKYKVVLQHRESWQQIGALLNSKADVQQFAFELSKKLDMGYQSPPMPIILDQTGRNNALLKKKGDDEDSVQELSSRLDAKYGESDKKMDSTVQGAQMPTVAGPPGPQLQKAEAEGPQLPNAAAAPKPQTEGPRLPQQVLATFVNTGMDPAMAKAELFHKTTRWASLGYQDSAISVGTYPGDQWYIVVDGVYVRLFTVGEGADQKFSI